MPEEIVAIAASAVLFALLVTHAFAQDSGTISGRVLDSSNGRPVGGASAVVEDMPDARGTTDAKGYFTISALPPGTYTVRLTATRYGSSVVTDVVVKPGEQTRISSSLTPETSQAIEVLEVSADVTESSEATQLLKRKMAPTVSDNLGAESISKTPDSDAAEVVTRVPAVTIKDGGFVIVRGLNERYNSALLNGSRLPSTDPDRRVVPLDLFPANFIESLSVVKSYTPNLPGDFAGGLIDIELAPPPEEFEGGLGISTAFNTVTTFQDFDTYDSTGLDWFALGDGYRGLDTDGTLEPLTTTPRMREFVGALPNNWNIDTITAPPDFSINGNAGGAVGPVRLFLSGLYGFKHRVQRDAIARSYDSSASQKELANFRYDRSFMEVTLGAVMTSELDITDDHKLSLRGLFNRTGEDEVLDGIGTTDDAGGENGNLVGSTSQIYTVDQLGYGQLALNSHFDWVDVDLRGGVGLTTRDQPDAKLLTRQENEEFDANGVPLFPIVTSDGSTTRRFVELDEVLQDYAADFSLPYSLGSLGSLDFLDNLAGVAQFGLAYANRDRDLHQTLYTSAESGLGRIPPETLNLPAEDVLVPENYQIGSALEFTDITSADSRRFVASQEIAGAYGMIDTSIIPNRLRFIGGARVEYSYIRAKGVTLRTGAFDQIINDLDPLPAASLVFSATDTMNIRGAYGRTVSRPELRELTPALFPRAIGLRTFQGNPFLVSTTIDNFDLRWEWFFSSLELASVGIFYKQMESPIETFALFSGSGIRDTVLNTEGGFAYGLEAELRKDFNFLVPRLRGYGGLRHVAPYLADLQLSVNASLVESESKEGIVPEDFPPIGVTNPVRQLQGQAPFTINVSLQYEHYQWGTFRLLYNTIGKTLDAVGTDSTPENDEPGAPDIFLERRDQLDFVWIIDLSPWERPTRLKFAAENITNDDFTYTQGSEITERYYTGVSFSLGLSTSF